MRSPYFIYFVLGVFKRKGVGSLTFYPALVLLSRGVVIFLRATLPTWKARKKNSDRSLLAAKGTAIGPTVRTTRWMFQRRVETVKCCYQLLLQPVTVVWYPGTFTSWSIDVPSKESGIQHVAPPTCTAVSHFYGDVVRLLSCTVLSVSNLLWRQLGTSSSNLLLGI